MDMRDFLLEQDKQFQGQLTAFKQALGGIQEALKAQGDQIASETAQAVQASGRKAVSEAQASLDRVSQAAQKVGELAQKASEATERAAKQSGEMLGRLEQASQRMVTSEQKVETALDELVPKVVGVRESLEKELGAVLQAAATAEAEIKRVVAGIGSTMTKEIEGEFKTKTREAASAVAQRLYGISEWWAWFSRVGTHVILIVVALSTGISGWWFGKHQLEEITYQEAIDRMRANARVNVYAYKFFPGPAGELKQDYQRVDTPLVWLGNGKFAAMTRNEQGQWVYGNVVVPKESLVLAEAFDSTREKDNLIKANRP
jgi:hypothetical protein